MGPSWKIGSAFGIGLYLHWSFLLVPVWGFAVVARELGVESGLYGAVLLLAMFGCVLLHELGHALTARRFGIGTRDITLYPIGGVARLERLPDCALQEFWIIVMGPAVNVVIAAVLIPTGVVASLANGEIAGIPRFVLELGSLNLWLAIFNMLPLFPMDGGRVLRAVLQFWLGRLTATEIAARIGLGLGLALMVTGMFATYYSNIQGMMLVLLSGFVIYVGRRELLDVRRRQHEMDTMTLQVLPADADVIDVNALPARPNFSGYTWDARLGMWVEWREGRPVHTIQVQPE
jgi:Zn-dependent protease